MNLNRNYVWKERLTKMIKPIRHGRKEKRSTILSQESARWNDKFRWIREFKQDLEEDLLDMARWRLYFLRNMWESESMDRSTKAWTRSCRFIADLGFCIIYLFEHDSSLVNTYIHIHSKYMTWRVRGFVAWTTKDLPCDFHTVCSRVERISIHKLILAFSEHSIPLPCPRLYVSIDIPSALLFFSLFLSSKTEILRVR